MILTSTNPKRSSLNNLKYLTRIFACGNLYKTLNYDLLYATNELFNLIQESQVDDSVETLDLDTKAMLDNGDMIDISLVLWREKEYGEFIGCAIERDDIDTFKKAKELQSNRSLAVTVS